ncbi:MAG: hypothetical protein K0U68_05040 [Gammaproteobacteria bacterium]|nr:hypothetical protein [Gammaproteobacteria bacterium]
MNLEALKSKALQLKSDLLVNIGDLTQILKKAGEDYKRAENLESFIKTFYNEELLQKPERIPVTLFSAWILILVLHWKFWIVFVFGILPIILYQLLKVLQKTPATQY